EVAPNHVRTAALSVAIAVNWFFAFTISKVTPVMLNRITYGTFLLLGIICMVMGVWTYFLFPETGGYALEDIRYLFEHDMIVRALEDAPGGKIFLGKKRSTPLEELRDADAVAKEQGGSDIEKDSTEMVEDTASGLQKA
ncbi:hypothetical protein EWM64_g3807, partial [Hericium alpestre]